MPFHAQAHGHGAELKRLALYLKSRPRVVFDMPFQDCLGIEVYSNTDWAGRLRTRKSTSGGCAMLWTHLVKAWSATQACLALSSGSAEYYGVTRDAGVGLGIQALLNNAEVSLPLRVWTDSEAVMGTDGRQGLGKLRHLECHSLWVQQQLRRTDFELRKVPGIENPAGLFPKRTESAARLDELTRTCNCKVESGRPAAAPQLKRAAPAATPHEQQPEAAMTTRDVHKVSGVSSADEPALPHLRLERGMEEYQQATPAENDYEEVDGDRPDDLTDPVRHLIRQAPWRHRAAKQNPSKSQAHGGRGRGGAARCLLIRSGALEVVMDGGGSGGHRGRSRQWTARVARDHLPYEPWGGAWSGSARRKIATHHWPSAWIFIILTACVIRDVAACVIIVTAACAIIFTHWIAPITVEPLVVRRPMADAPITVEPLAEMRPMATAPLTVSHGPRCGPWQVASQRHEKLRAYRGSPQPVLSWYIGVRLLHSTIMYSHVHVRAAGRTSIVSLCARFRRPS